MKFKIDDIIEYVGINSTEYKTVYKVVAIGGGDMKSNYYLVQLLYASTGNSLIDSRYTLQEDAAYYFRLVEGTLKILYG